MMKLSETGERLDDLLDVECAEEWDNVGWMVGPTSRDLTGVTLAVDPSPEALDAAVESGHNLLVTHHPLIFESLDRLVEGTPVHDTIMRAVREHVGIYAAHTNVDSMVGGLNDHLADLLGLAERKPIRPLEAEPQAGLGRLGSLRRETTVRDIEETLVEELDLTVLEALGDPDLPVESIAVCSGSGGDFIGPELRRQVDLYVTADVDHHEANNARQLGLPLLILDHYEMESVFTGVAEDRLAKLNLDVPVDTFVRGNPYRRTVR